jgi:hypothetical protein
MAGMRSSAALVVAWRPPSRARRPRPGRGALRLAVALLAGICLGPLATVSGAQVDVPPVSCGELRDLGLAVVLTDRDLAGADETGLCIVARPDEDTFIAYLPNVFTTDAFRAAKARYGAALAEDSAAFDVCRIGSWRPLNREGTPPVPLSAADQLDGPATCPPRIVARGPAAEGWIAAVEESLAAIAARATADLGITPRRPLTVELYADQAAFAAAVTGAAQGDGPPPRVGDGRSLILLSPARGMVIRLNLTGIPDAAALRRRLAHEYVHFLQAAAGGTLDAYPMWFLEGQAEYEMERLAGREQGRLAEAAGRARADAAPRLPELVTAADWAAAEARLGADAVYAHAYGAVAFLAERWGYEATVRLLAAGSDVEPDRFAATLAAVTGLDAEGLDRALAAWLRGLSGSVTFYNGSPLALRLLLPDGRSILLPPCPTCTFLRASEPCRETAAWPFTRLDLPVGDYTILWIVPDDRVHFPDRPIRVRIEPRDDLIKPLCLAV